ncbi:MAG: protein translocase subunit SecF [Actinobacteria bacterium]|nr:protein translocase subunit SecF [Actinomycetota bacterium]
MMAKNSLAARLYSGQVSYDFVGRRNRWYVISGIIVLVAIAGLFTRGLNLGLDFVGGSQFQVKTTATVEQGRAAAKSAGIPDAVVTKVGNDKLQWRTTTLDSNTLTDVVKTLATTFKVNEADIATESVGPTWGKEITSKAFQGLVVFLILVALFLSIYFQWQMALAALFALAHDLIITVGIYALSGFEVTPATVIGVLTILGFSLYDTVVVFDKVRENTAGLLKTARMTYSDAANLALNQTLVRSINTSIIALLPVASILVIGVGFLGAGTLKDLALALFVGTIAGTYSSIFVATPFLAQIRERNPQMAALAKRVSARRAADADRAAGIEPTTDVESANAIPMRQVGERAQPKRNIPRSKR